MMRRGNLGLVIAAVVFGVVFCSLPVQAEYGGGSGTATDPYLIYTAEQLNAIGANPGDWNKHFKLMADIDLSGFGGGDFNTIGRFTGTFNGNDKKIFNLTLTSWPGMFSVISGEIKNLGLINPYIARDRGIAGALVGWLDGGAVTNCYVEGGVVEVKAAGEEFVGGLVGNSYRGTISKCYYIGSVSGGASALGGLAGKTSRGTVTNCYSSGSVSGGVQEIGGLIGMCKNGTVSQCYSRAKVTSNSSYFTSGFIGYVRSSTVENCYATGRVHAKTNYAAGFIETCDEYGDGPTRILNCYSVGKVTAQAGEVSGFLGYRAGGTVVGCFWDRQRSGVSTSDGGIGKTTAEMQTESTFTSAGWDFTTPIWQMCGVVDYFYPQLWWEECPELVGLGITGPNEVAENFEMQFRAIAHYDSGSTKDVTDSAEWLVEPNSVANIDEIGILTTEGINTLEEDVTIYAQYTEGDVTFEAEKEVVVFAICPTGSALSFDGVNDYVEVVDDDSLTPSSELTISTWLYINDISWSDRTSIICKYDYPHDRAYQLDLGKNNAPDKSTVCWYVSQTKSPFTGKIIYGTTQLQPGRWYHIVTTFEANHAEIYVNGIEETDGTDTSIANSIPNNDEPLYIGYSKGEDTYFDGTIDDVRIYDRVLSAEEIQANTYTRLDGDEPNLVGYWDFDESEGQIAYDLSGNDNHGYLGSDPCGPDESDPAWVESDAPIGICSTYLLAKRGISRAIGRKIASLEELEAALAEEASSLEALQELLASGDLGDLSRWDVLKAKRKIRAAMRRQKLCKVGLQRSISKLEDALAQLGCEVEPQVWPEPEMEEEEAVIRADINADGVVNFHDFAILMNHWLESYETE